MVVTFADRRCGEVNCESDMPADTSRIKNSSQRMHRRDATTVSYTEVTISGQSVTMRYKPGSACLRSDRDPNDFARTFIVSLPRLRRQIEAWLRKT